MGKKKAPATPMNAAPLYQPPSQQNASAVPGWQVPGSGSVPFTAPPPQGENSPFINAPWLWANGDQNDQLRRVQAKITGLRQATGGNPAFQNRGGFFLDCVLANGAKVTARVNIGDNRHQRLYAKFQNNIVGQTVTFRLSHPGDGTKAPWTVE
jgi:hypothetical protein